MKPACAYRYDSPVVKTSERRLDGFLEPLQAGCPYYFVEVQGYYDDRIYWRGLHPVTRYHETRSDLDGQDWRLIVFFLDKAYDPGVATLGPLAAGSKRWLSRGVLPSLLARLPQSSPSLNVLRPLAVRTVNQVRRQGPVWVQSIRELTALDERQRNGLVDLLVKFVVQRFVDLPYKEVEAMLKLTPLEQTRAGQELIQLGIEEGRQEGRQEGLREGILAVLSVRFAEIPETQLSGVSALLEHITDEETIEILLNLAKQVESFAAFEQKVAELAQKEEKEQTQ
jgi:predicted transposase YdaD